MNVVDSLGWLEYFADGPAAEEFAPAIEHLEDLVVPSICILEVFKRVLQQRDEGSALEAAAVMQQATVQDLDVPIALSAGRLGVEHGLPLADSVVLATAWRHGALLWTQDSDFEGLHGVRNFPKKGRRGLS